MKALIDTPESVRNWHLLSETAKAAMTQQQAQNLMDLRDYLKDMPEGAPEFTMSVYAGCASMSETHCGSMGCAVGHASIVITPKQRGEIWPEYFGRVFGWNMSLFTTAFDSEWASFDNTPTEPPSESRDFSMKAWS